MFITMIIDVHRDDERTSTRGPMMFQTTTQGVPSEDQ
jgi:hypothetical protein